MKLTADEQGNLLCELPPPEGISVTYVLDEQELTPENLDSFRANPTLPFLVERFDSEQRTFVVSLAKGRFTIDCLYDTRLGARAQVARIEKNGLLLTYGGGLSLFLRSENLLKPYRKPPVRAELTVYPVQWRYALKNYNCSEYAVLVSERAEDAAFGLSCEMFPMVFSAQGWEELYDYLSSLTDDDEYFQVLENLSDDIFSELIDYINSVTAGESVEVTEESDNGIVDFLNAAPLMSSGIQAPMFMRANYATGFDKTDTAVAGGLKIKKSLENYHASTGEGTLLLEAYVTGKVTTETKSKPVDVILVLDQSGSMANKFGNKVSVYTKQNWNNGQAYNNRNNEIYVRGEDENYYKVTVDRAGGTISYEKASGDIRAKQLGDNKYYYLAADGNYYSITTEEDFGKTSIYANGNEIYSWRWFSGDGDTKIENIEALKDKVFKREVKYSYTYRSEGIENGVVSSEGANTETPVSLYLRQEKTLTALESLTNAVQNFTDSVAEKNPNNRIAIVGFGSDSGDGNNTEILTLPGKNSGSVGKKYSNRLSADDYKNAMVSASDPIVDKAINALASEGATRTDLGMEMARKILV